MILPKKVIFHNTLFVFTFMYLMVSPHISYAEQQHYKALNTAQFKISKKITKDDKLFDDPVFIRLTTHHYFVRFESVQAFSEVCPSPRHPLLFLSTTRLIL